MRPFDEWPDPKYIGDGEYTAVYEYISDVIESNGDTPEMIRGCLECLIETCQSLLDA